MSNMQAWDADRAQARIRELEHLPGALLPILHALQEEFGYIDPAATPLIADALNLSHAEVHGVISFYHDFRHAARWTPYAVDLPRRILPVHGLREVGEHVEKRAGIKLGETTPDGSLTVEQVFCLGNCALSPAVHAGWRAVWPRIAERRRFPDR